MRNSRSRLAAAVVTALAGLALEARTAPAADIAGDWSLPQDVFLRCSRQGDVVSCQFLPTLLPLEGSCDTGTGAFSFPVPPVPPPPGSGSFPPGPDGSFTGTVAPDGQSFDGTLTLCMLIGSTWSCVPIPMDGTRFDAADAECDNGLVEPSETCDQGSFDGVSMN